MTDIILTTTDTKQPYKICKILFSVHTEGLHVGLDWIAGWKNILGGKIKGYENRIRKAQEKALDNLKLQAEEMGCNAIIGINQRIETIPIEKNAAIIVSLSGTAVKLLPLSPSTETHQQPVNEVTSPISDDSPDFQSAYNP